MRILMLNYEFPPLGGGGGVAAKKLAKGFVSLGYEVDYVTTWFKGLKKYEKVDGINVYRIKVIGRKELPTATMSSLISFPFFAYKKTKELCNKNSYAFVNTHFAVPTGPLGVWISKKYKIKNILSIHGGDIYDPSKNNSPHKKWYLRKVVNWVLNNFDYIVAQSSNTQGNTLKFYNPNKEIKIIPLAYEPFEFKKVSREDLGLNNGLFYTISIGRLVKRKGFDFLIKSIARLNNDNVHSLIIGDGPEKENLEKLAKNLNVEKQVHFLGSLSEEKKFQYLANSDIYVLSSIHEGFAIVLQEAMQVGLPIIATNNGGQVDLIQDGKNGFLIDYNDEFVLADKIPSLMLNQKLMREMKINNQLALARFSLKDVAERYLSLVL